MLKNSEQGYYFISRNNNKYSLYQGYCINSAIENCRNDICYIHNEDGKLIGWFYGVETDNKEELEELEKAIKYYVDLYEKNK